MAKNGSFLDIFGQKLKKIVRVYVPRIHEVFSYLLLTSTWQCPYIKRRRPPPQPQLNPRPLFRKIGFRYLRRLPGSGIRNPTGSGVPAFPTPTLTSVFVWWEWMGIDLRSIPSPRTHTKTGMSVGVGDAGTPLPVGFRPAHRFVGRRRPMTLGFCSIFGQKREKTGFIKARQK